MAPLVPVCLLCANQEPNITEYKMTTTGSLSAPVLASPSGFTAGQCGFFTVTRGPAIGDTASRRPLVTSFCSSRKGVMATIVLSVVVSLIGGASCGSSLKGVLGEGGIGVVINKSGTCVKAMQTGLIYGPRDGIICSENRLAPLGACIQFVVTNKPSSPKIIDVVRLNETSCRIPSGG